MRLRGKVAIGGGAVSAVTAGALVIGGVFAGSATLVAVDPGARPAQADSLTSFAGCKDLRDWYVENNLSEVGPYGWGGQQIYFAMKGGLSAMSNSARALTDSAPGVADERARTTGTNTQEVDVDEPDVAKTDGRLLVRLTRPRKSFTDQMLAVSDVSGAEKHTLGRLHLPETSQQSELLLVGTHVVVTQPVEDFATPSSYGGSRPLIDRPGTTATRVLDIDVSDPRHPRLVGTDVYSGSLLSARQYGDTIRLVTDTGRPELKWWTPESDNVSPAVATAHNKKLVAHSSIEDWLPSVTHAGRTERLTSCADVYRPSVWSGSDTIAVTTFEAGAPAARSAIGITASGGIVYSSVDHLYVASTPWQHPGPVPLDARIVPGGRVAVPGSGATDLHAFTLTATGTRYLGSGHIGGTVRDRWSLDEQDGYLRVAWSTQDRGGVRNGISVLKAQDDGLQPIGTLDGLGVDETLESVRWFEDFAVLVTFQQRDPLYTIDLTDPNTPRRLGVLTVPGYSGYLHPIGGNRLLGLGVDGGFGGHGQAAVFDIEDLTRPRQVSRIEFGPGTHLQVLDDPRMFTWLPGKHTGLTPVWDGRQQGYPERLRVDAMTVASDGTLSTRTVARLREGWQPRILPLDGDRVAIVDGDRVQLIKL